MENKEDLLKKIKALAKRGVGGEKESAQKILEHLMKKYGISETALETKRVETTWFPYRDEFECRILSQIIYMVTGKSSYGCVGKYTERKRKKRGVDCTAAQRVEIEANYDFYIAAAKEELELFFTAFAYTNKLFPNIEDNTDKGDNAELTPEEKKKLFKAGLMAEGMERRTLRKMIEGSNAE